MTNSTLYFRHPIGDYSNEILQCPDVTFPGTYISTTTRGPASYINVALNNNNCGTSAYLQMYWEYTNWTFQAPPIGQCLIPDPNVGNVVSNGTNCTQEFNVDANTTTQFRMGWPWPAGMTQAQFQQVAFFFRAMDANFSQPAANFQDGSRYNAQWDNTIVSPAVARDELLFFALGVTNRDTEPRRATLRAAPMLELDSGLSEAHALRLRLAAGGRLRTPRALSLTLGQERVVQGPLRDPSYRPRLQNTGVVSSETFNLLREEHAKHAQKNAESLEVELASGELRQLLLSTGSAPMGNDFYLIKIQKELHAAEGRQVKEALVAVLGCEL